MATPTKEAQIRRWMRENGRGYKAAGKHFDIHPDEVRRLLGRPPSRTRARETNTDHPADMDEEQYFRSQLEQLHEDMAAMRAKGSFQALTAATRQAMVTREKLDQIRKEREAAEFDPHKLDDIVRELLMLPDDVWQHPDVIQRISMRVN